MKKYVLILEENQSTGYKWEIVGGLNWLSENHCSVETAYIPHNHYDNKGEPRVGGGGQRIFTFYWTEKYPSMLPVFHLEYRRPFDPGDVADTFDFCLGNNSSKRKKEDDDAV